MANSPEPASQATEQAAPVAKFTVTGAAALLATLLFLLVVPGTRLGLHNEINPIFAPLWLIFGSTASVLVYRTGAFNGWRRLLRLRWLAKRLEAVLVLIGWIAGLIIILGPPNDPHGWDTRRQGRCRSHLGDIYHSLRLYADGNGGRFPDRLERLLTDPSFDTDMFVCPSTDDTPAQGRTPADVADQLASGGHLSYVYAGKGLDLNWRGNDKQVVLYESRRNHHTEYPGVHVLYSNGDIDYLEGQAAIETVHALGVGRNPPRRQ